MGDTSAGPGGKDKAVLMTSLLSPTLDHPSLLYLQRHHNSLYSLHGNFYEIQIQRFLGKCIPKLKTKDLTNPM